MCKLFHIIILRKKPQHCGNGVFQFEANRGDIIDTNGNIIATNLTTASLVVIPAQIEDPVRYASLIAPILEADEKALCDKFSKKV